MNYQVEWLPEADNDLAEAWTLASSPSDVTAAVTTLERILSVDPVHYGKLLSEGLWRIATPPLIVYYSINLELRQVEITSVAHTA